MARINIEDSLFRDFKFIELCIKTGSKETALGALVWAFIVAQKHYLDESNDRLIPHEEWRKQSCSDLLVEFGFAKVLEKGVYVKGSETQFAWLKQRVDAGRRGGLAQRDKKTATSEPEKRSAVAKRSLSGGERSLSGAKPLTLPLPLTPTLKEYSVGEKKQKTPVGQTAIAVADNFTQVIEKENVEAGKGDSIRKFIATYVKAYEKKFPGQRPVELGDGKILGQIKNLMKTFPVEKACELAEAYFQIEDPWFEKRGYPFSVFRENLNKISQALASGNTSTSGINWKKFIEDKQ